MRRSITCGRLFGAGLVVLSCLPVPAVAQRRVEPCLVTAAPGPNWWRDTVDAGSLSMALPPYLHRLSSVGVGETPFPGSGFDPSPGDSLVPLREWVPRAPAVDTVGILRLVLYQHVGQGEPFMGIACSMEVAGNVAQVSRYALAEIGSGQITEYHVSVNWRGFQINAWGTHEIEDTVFGILRSISGR